MRPEALACERSSEMKTSPIPVDPMAVKVDCGFQHRGRKKRLVQVLKKNCFNFSVANGANCNGIVGKPSNPRINRVPKPGTAGRVLNEKLLKASVLDSKSDPGSKNGEEKTPFLNQRPQHTTMIRAVLLLMLCGLLAGDLAAPAAEEPETVVVTVDSTSLRFSPSSIEVSEGDTVRFFWSDQALAHNAVADDGLFDSGDPERTVDYSFTFERGMNGTYTYVCEPHEGLGMVGEIVVTALPPEAPPVEPTVSEDTPFLPFVGLLVAALAAVVVRPQS